MRKSEKKSFELSTELAAFWCHWTHMHIQSSTNRGICDKIININCASVSNVYNIVQV